MLPAVGDIYAARRRLAPHLQPTPLLPSPWLSSLTGAEVFLKLESVNLTSSFKIRGALNAALKAAEQATTTLVTASAGNHGRALALAAERLRLGCVVFTPATAPAAKKDAIRRHGAALHDECEDYDAAEAQAKAWAAAEGGVYVSPYNHPDVIAGAGTIGLELLEVMPDLDVVVIPLGGGGLASGIGMAVKAAAPGATIAGVEVEASAPFTAGRRAGRITPIAPRASLADGLTGNLEADAITFRLVQQLVDAITIVNEADLISAMRGLAAEERLIVEGAGAAATAAVVSGKMTARGQRAVVMVTGANVDLPRWLDSVR
jgi:threonine dehydratase